MDDLIYVAVYADTVDEYPSDLIDFMLSDGAMGNFVDIQFPRSIVKEWYETRVRATDESDFDTWLRDEYTCDDTDGLYQFAKDKSFDPKPPMPDKYEVEFSSTYIVYSWDGKDEAVKIARNMRRAGDYSVYVDGDLYS